jgi:hypothetical protein
MRPGTLLDRDGTIIVGHRYVGSLDRVEFINGAAGAIAITGSDGGAATAVAEVAIRVDCTSYGIAEDLHQAVMHSLAQFVRQSPMTADTISERCSEHDVTDKPRSADAGSDQPPDG